MKGIERVGLVTRVDEEGATELAMRLYDHLIGAGVKAIPESDFARRKALQGGKSLSNMGDVDLVVTIGGDGTVLKTCMLLPNPEIPILAINMGRRGYLTEVDPEDAIPAIDKCLRGECFIERHSKISIFVDGDYIIDALNDALIAPAIPSKMLTFEIYQEYQSIIKTRADALIVATPTGSTAHSLSAGGPIVDTSLNSFLLTFICPLDPIGSIVVSAEKELDIKVPSPAIKTVLIADGRYERNLKPSSKISIKPSPRKAAFVRFQKPFFMKNLPNIISRGKREGI
ncbi:MAG: NAD(+)/NADH kinase [Candidatus Bathyarchaeia archaeon]